MLHFLDVQSSFARLPLFRRRLFIWKELFCGESMNEWIAPADKNSGKKEENTNLSAQGGARFHVEGPTRKRKEIYVKRSQHFLPSIQRLEMETGCVRFTIYSFHWRVSSIKNSSFRFFQVLIRLIWRLFTSEKEIVAKSICKNTLVETWTFMNWKRFWK